MFRIKVVRTIKRSAQSVFDALSDHEHYASFPMIDESVLLTPGETEKNGNGALRKIRSGRFEVLERIYDVQNQSQICYKIETARPIPMDHQVGRIEIEALNEDHSRVTWVSEGRIKLPLVGRFLDKKMEENGTRVFHRMLKHVEEHGRLS